MERQASGRWRWRLPLALAGSVIAAIQIAWLLAGFRGWADPLDRLYAGLFVGFATGHALLLVSLLAPTVRQVLVRLAVCLVPLTSLVVVSLYQGG